MEREVGDSLQIGITLIILAALISIIWVTVSIGNGLKVSNYDKATSITTSINSSQLNSIKYNDSIIAPKISAYNLVSQESAMITSLVYKYNFDGIRTRTVTMGTDSKWIAKGSIADKQYALLQDILVAEGSKRLNEDGTVQSDKLTGKVSIYVEQNEDTTFKVTITDLD